MNANKFILLPTSAATNTAIFSFENKRRYESAEDVLETSFCANVPVINKCMREKDARDL